MDHADASPRERVNKASRVSIMRATPGMKIEADHDMASVALDVMRETRRPFQA